MQIRCNSCMYSQTFPSAVRLWNCVPPDTCYLALESFKLELSKINLIWSRTKFLSHRTAWFYFLKMGFLSTWPAPAARYYSTTELALVSEDEQENPAAFKAQLSRCAPVRMPWPTTTISVILHEEDCWLFCKTRQDMRWRWQALFSVPVLTLTLLTLTLSLTLTLILTVLTTTIHRGRKIAWSRSNYPSLGTENIYRVVQKKNAQNLMHYIFSTAGHRVTRFPAKCSETNW